MWALIAPVFSLLVSTFFMQLASGMAGYLIPLRASAEGWQTTDISFIAAGFAFAFTLGCIVVPRLVFRVGHVRVFSALIALMSMSLLLHTLVVNPLIWIVFRAIAGFCLAGCYMVIESWLNEKAPNESRGKLFSIYMIITMIGLMAGQFIVPQGDIHAPTLFIICALAFSFALLPTTLSSTQSPNPMTQVQFNLKNLFVLFPVSVIGAVLSGIMTGTWTSLGPVYASIQGLSATEGASMLAMAVIGGAIFQYPFGWVSDRVDRRKVMVALALTGGIVSLAASFFGVESRIIFFSGVVLLGAMMFPLYSIIIAHANDFAEADAFVETSSGLLIIYGIGTIIGPIVTAPMMDYFGPSGMFISIAASLILIAFYALYRITQREQAPEDERTEFHVTPLARVQTPQLYELDPRVDPEWGNMGDDEDTDDGNDETSS